MTPKSAPWCSASVPCRIDWRPSRCLVAALLFLAVAAPFAVMASEMPRPVAWPLAAAALVHGLHLVLRERARPRRSLLFTADGRLLVDDAEALAPRLQWRGPLAFLSWREPAGRSHRLAWWPDSLPPRWRRELRLAVSRLDPARGAPSMAP